MAQKFALTVRLDDDDRRRLDRCAEEMGESMSALAAHIIHNDLPKRLDFHQRGKEQEPERVKFAVAVSAADAETVSKLWEKVRAKFGLRDVPMEQIVGNIVYGGQEIEQFGRLYLDRPKWPPYPDNPRIIQASMGSWEFAMVEGMGEADFESIETTVAAFFKLGLPGYIEQVSKYES